MKDVAFFAVLAVLILNRGQTAEREIRLEVSAYTGSWVFSGSQDHAANPYLVDNGEDFSDYDNEIEVSTIPSNIPRVVSTGDYFRAAVGESITLPCEGEFPDNSAVLWKKVDSDLTLSTNSTPEDDRFQLVNRSSLRISALVPTDSGEYTCQIDTEPTLEVTHNLAITSRPSHGGSCSGKSSKWMDLGGSYCYIIEKDSEVEWINAVLQCFQEGGSLATLVNMEEVKRIQQYIQPSDGKFYIGLWKHNEGSFEWVDKSTSNFRNWAEREPNDRGETCVEMYPDSLKWNDVPCHLHRGYICSSLKAETARNSNYVCPSSSSEWKDYGSEYCYIIELYNVTTSEGAAARCSAAGGTLSSFHSVEEIAVVREQIRHHHDRLHIGLRQDSDGIFEWLDRSPLDLEFWDSGEPNDVMEECGEMYPSSGQWNDIPCDKLVGYICSTPKVNPEIEAKEPPQVSIGEVCGGDITAESGTIQSPNYPENYSPNANCLWKITVPENFQIQLNFQALQLEYGASCEYDYVEVLDGHEPGSPVLRKFCGSQDKQMIVSSENKMVVKFSSDHINQRSGFLAEFRKVSRCGENIVAEEGVIQTRNYPNNYWPNDMCTWKITVPENKAVLLKFKAFQTEESENCMKDYVHVIDGHDGNGAILDQKCGLYQPHQNPPEVLSFGHKITVRFVSDGFKEYYGFLAEFQTVEVNETALYTPPPSVLEEDACINTIDFEAGTLVSPHYPEQYRSYEECTWNIRGPPGSIINLRFKMFELESSSTCSYDYVKVCEGGQHSSSSLGKFCGTTSPGLITSSGNEITVHFKTDSSGVYRGFAAVFNISEGGVVEPVVEKTEKEEEEDGTACKQDIIADEGIIQSPNYPENYGPNERCFWKITVPTGHQVVLNFNDTSVEEHFTCAYDYILVREGHSENSEVLAKFCGTTAPLEIRSCQNKLMIEFHSDSSTGHRGFSAEFKKDLLVPGEEPPHCTNACGGDIIAENGTIESPHYPHRYGPLQNCTWKITVPENHLVSLKFESLDLEYSRWCSYDQVEVLNGDNIDSPVMSTICSYQESAFLSSKNQMTVTFTSDDSFERTGFKATFQKVVLCGGNITEEEEGVLQSPNITDAYLCSWRITVTETFNVRLKIHADPEKNVKHGSFSVMIRDGPDEYTNFLDKFSSLDQEVNLRSRSHEMFVEVRSDGSSGLPHFYAEFKKDVCGGNIVADNGTITSQDYPNYYMPYETCIWNITVPEGYKVLLTFQSFKVETSENCRYDSVNIVDGHDQSLWPSRKFCGDSIPDPFISTTNKMSVRFWTDSSTEEKGFSATFVKELSETETEPEPESTTVRSVPSEDIENMLHQLPNIIFESAQRKEEPSRGKKKKSTITKRSLTHALEKVLKLL